MKPSLSWAEQVALLQSRGLVVGEEADCARFLAATNYYRFSGYTRYFQRAPHEGDDRFRTGVGFEEVRTVYRADEELRSRLQPPLAHVELMLRSHVARVISDEHGPYGRYLDEGFFTDADKPNNTGEACLRDISRSRDRHVLRYRDDESGRSDFAALPVWSAVEAWSFGTLSRVIERGDGGSLGGAIAESIGAARTGFAQRVKALVYLRNRCAHHSRLWHHSVIDAGPTPNNVRSKAKRKVGQFGHRSILDVIASLDDLAVRGHSPTPILPELTERFHSVPAYWEGLADPRDPRDHV